MANPFELELNVFRDAAPAPVMPRAAQVPAPVSAPRRSIPYTPKDEFRAILQSLPPTMKVDQKTLVDLMRVAQENYQAKLKGHFDEVNAGIPRPLAPERAATEAMKQKEIEARIPYTSGQIARPLAPEVATVWQQRANTEQTRQGLYDAQTGLANRRRDQIGVETPLDRERRETEDARQQKLVAEAGNVGKPRPLGPEEKALTQQRERTQKRLEELYGARKDALSKPKPLNPEERELIESRTDANRARAQESRGRYNPEAARAKHAADREAEWLKGLEREVIEDQWGGGPDDALDRLKQLRPLWEEEARRIYPDRPAAPAVDPLEEELEQLKREREELLAQEEAEEEEWEEER